MKTVALILLVVVAFNCTSQSTPIEDEEKLIGISEEILENMVAGNYEAMTKEFNETMLKQISAQKLKEVYEGLKPKTGEYQKKGEIITDMIENYRTVYIVMKFENTPLKLKVMFDDQDLVAGLWILPVTAR